MAKAKMTGFTKFLILMIIVGPLAFLGASYYRGEDGIAAIKSLFSKNKAHVVTEITEDEVTPQPKVAGDRDKVVLESQLNKYKDELAQKDRVIDTLYLENTKLKSDLAAKIKEMEQAKIQLEKVKSVLNK